MNALFPEEIYAAEAAIMEEPVEQLVWLGYWLGRLQYKRGREMFAESVREKEERS
jgi:hypothetical protein